MIERIRSTLGLSFSDAVVVPPDGGRRVVISGQLPVDEAGNIVGRTLGEQARACFDNIERVLQSLGAPLGSVVRIRAYLKTLEGYEQYARVRADRLDGQLPASTTVGGVDLLGGALIEIDAEAIIAEES